MVCEARLQTRHEDGCDGEMDNKVIIEQLSHQRGEDGVPEQTAGKVCDTDEQKSHCSEDESEVDSEVEPEVDDEEGNGLQKALDGGYGWVVVFASFIHHVIVGGFARSEGLFFLQYQERFQSGAQLTAWPSSLMSTLNFFMGPICGAIINRYSVRTALILATILTSAGFILNGFAPNVYFLFFSTTLVGGLGRGLMSTVLLINLYFDKHRSVAQGLSSAGVGLGAFAIVPLVQILFEIYGFTGAFLIIGGMELNGLVTSMMFRPLSMHRRFLKADRLRKQRIAKTQDDMALTLTGLTHRHMDTTAQVDGVCDVPGKVINGESKLVPNNCNKIKGHQYGDLDAHYKTLTEFSLLEFEKNCSNGRIDNLMSETASREIVTQSFFSNRENGVRSKVVPDTKMRTKKDNWLKSSIAICFPIEHTRKGADKKTKTFHWHLLKNIPFLIFCISNTFFLMAFKTAFTFLPAMAISKGLSKTEAALVLTISGALDTFGRMTTGFLMDIPACRPFRPYVFNLLLFFIAGASFLVPSLDSFASFCVVSSAYGFMTGAFISQKMVVLIDILGREVMPSSLGISKVFQGIGTLVGPPFAGALRDALGTFDSSFYLGGACMLGSGILMVVSNVLRKIQSRKDTRT